MAAELPDEGAAPSMAAAEAGGKSPDLVPFLPLVQAPAGDAARAAFETEGFVIAEQMLPMALCDALALRLEAMLRGQFDSGSQPDKVPACVPAEPGAAAPQRSRKPRVEQFVNAWKGDLLFSAVVQNQALAEWVADLAGWPEGAEVLQDQVWCKPPGSGPIAFHRDKAYMGEGVVTLWLTLDDLEPRMGPLEYARGSHRWPETEHGGYAPSLFGKKEWRAELEKSAALQSATVADGVPKGSGSPAKTVQVLVPRGGGSVHDGRTWHGSAINTSGRPRRGLGVHFGPVGRRPAPPTELARHMRAAEPAVAVAVPEEGSAAPAAA